jgi:hypothetical protein
MHDEEAHAKAQRGKGAKKISRKDAKNAKLNKLLQTWRTLWLCVSHSSLLCAFAP